MALNSIIGICIAIPLALFLVYLGGRMFGLGFATSVKQLKHKQETKSGTRQ